MLALCLLCVHAISGQVSFRQRFAECLLITCQTLSVVDGALAVPSACLLSRVRCGPAPCLAALGQLSTVYSCLPFPMMSSHNVVVPLHHRNANPAGFAPCAVHLLVSSCSGTNFRKFRLDAAEFASHIVDSSRSCYLASFLGKHIDGALQFKDCLHSNRAFRTRLEC